MTALGEERRRRDHRRLADENEHLRHLLVALLETARVVEQTVPDYLDPSTCTSDPCPCCTVMTQLQAVLLDAEDWLAAHGGEGSGADDIEG